MSLKEQLHEEDTMTHDLDDDLSSNSKINEFGNEAKDDQNMILHNFELPTKDLMDQGLNDLIKVEAPTQMVNLILQHQQLLEGQMIEEGDY